MPFLGMLLESIFLPLVMGFPLASDITFFAVVFFIFVVSIRVWFSWGLVCSFVRIKSFISFSIRKLLFRFQRRRFRWCKCWCKRWFPSRDHAPSGEDQDQWFQDSERCLGLGCLAVVGLTWCCCLLFWLLAFPSS